MDLILGHRIDLVIDTPTQGRDKSRDGFLIRRTAIETGVNCINPHWIRQEPLLPVWKMQVISFLLWILQLYKLQIVKGTVVDAVPF